MNKAVFLDRDGVINRLYLGNYVTKWEHFEFLEGAKDAIKDLAQTDFKIIIITNQSPINRGLMTEYELKVIHEHMVDAIREAGGRIDSIYFCPHAPHEECTCRKPEPGMFDQAIGFHDIDVKASWFIGDFESDEEAAARVGLNFKLAEGDGGLRKAVDEILNENC